MVAIRLHRKSDFVNQNIFGGHDDPICIYANLRLHFNDRHAVYPIPAPFSDS